VTPEQAVWTATIEAAVLDALSPHLTGATQLEKMEAWTWLMSDSEEPGSFMWTADQIGLSDETIYRIRERLMDPTPLAYGEGDA